ncbi:hypothetical protein BDV12DRAFT_186825 [Aspergillus spectabilis]
MKTITLVCEMVRVNGDRDELAFLCAVDFFTGEVLITITSRFSGVTPEAMAAAVAAGQALSGWKSEREALWIYNDTESVLIGHSLNDDLKVLQFIHPKIVDSAILAAETFSSWRLALAFLNRKIQTGKKGHDCLEDTFATRDVVIWCLRNPDLLAAGPTMPEPNMKLKNGR